jgi:hypothetical protein
MRPRFQADENLNAKIVAGLLRREPSLDFQSAKAGNLLSLDDPEVLAIAAGRHGTIMARLSGWITMPDFTRPYWKVHLRGRRQIHLAEDDEFGQPRRTTFCGVWYQPDEREYAEKTAKEPGEKVCAKCKQSLLDWVETWAAEERAENSN